jgi:uncharacterized protein YbjT (DUF2867 family)
MILVTGATGGGFAANTLGWAPMIRAEGVVRVPYLNAATAPIAEEDISAAAVRVLLGDGHEGARYVLTGPGSPVMRPASADRLSAGWPGGGAWPDRTPCPARRSARRTR